MPPWVSSIANVIRPPTEVELAEMTCDATPSAVAMYTPSSLVISIDPAGGATGGGSVVVVDAGTVVVAGAAVEVVVLVATGAAVVVPE